MLKIVTEMNQQEIDLWEDLEKAWAEVMDLRLWDDTNDHTDLTRSHELSKHE